MRFKIVTLFPELFGPFFEEGIIGRAVSAGQVDFSLVQLREYANDMRYNKVDDYPYGGGSGMLLKYPVLADSLQAIKQTGDFVVALSPDGKQLDRDLVCQLAQKKSLVLYCGRYEGFDQRFVDRHVDLSVSIGDYVLMGGELPAMTLIEAVARRIDGVLGSQESFEQDSFEDGLLEGGHYTRPPLHAGDAVPDVLLSGNHAHIEKWRRGSSLRNTYINRPELLKNSSLTEDDRSYLKQIFKELYCGGRHKRD